MVLTDARTEAVDKQIQALNQRIDRLDHSHTILVQEFLKVLRELPPKNGHPLE